MLSPLVNQQIGSVTQFSAEKPLPTPLPRLLPAAPPAQIVTTLQRSGALIVDLTALSDAASDAYFLGLQPELGYVIKDETTPEGWYRVSDKGAYANRHYLADQPGTFPLHTDRAFSPDPPPIIGLLCKRRATQGGETLLIDGKQLYLQLLRDLGADSVSSLFQCVYRIERSSLALSRPLFFYNDRKRTCIAYRRGDSAATVTIEPGFERLVRKIDSYLLDPSQQLRVMLEPQELLLIDNHRFLHGRTAFSGQRLLYRLYFSANTATSPATGFIGAEDLMGPHTRHDSEMLGAKGNEPKTVI